MLTLFSRQTENGNSNDGMTAAINGCIEGRGGTDDNVMMMMMMVCYS